MSSSKSRQSDKDNEMTISEHNAHLVRELKKIGITAGKPSGNFPKLDDDNDEYECKRVYIKGGMNG